MDANGAERYFPWDVLELDPTSDQRAIKRAYARLLRRHNPEDDAAGFQRLREAFERAQQEAKWLELEPWGDDEPSDGPAEPAGTDIAGGVGAATIAIERAAAERQSAPRIEPAETEAGELAAAPPEPALRVEPATESDAESRANHELDTRSEGSTPPEPEPIWTGPEPVPLPDEPPPEVAEALAEADPFEALCAAAENILSDRDAASIELRWQELLYDIDRAGIDARRVFGDWLFDRLYEFDKSRPWGNPAFHGIPRTVWLTLDRQFGWAADEIKLAARHSDEAIVSVMGAVRRARGEKAETARGGHAVGEAPATDEPGKTPWWVWWLVIWVVIAVIRLVAK
jgi:hypothetical protein